MGRDVEEGRDPGSMSCNVFRENGALGSGPMFWAAAVRAVKIEAGSTRVKAQTTTINLARRPPVLNGDVFFMRFSSLLSPGRSSGRSPGPGLGSNNINRDPCSYQNRLGAIRDTLDTLDTLAVGVDELHRGVAAESLCGLDQGVEAPGGTDMNGEYPFTSRRGCSAERRAQPGRPRR
jgi:hypothetical protein